jgi:hypothetical protein
MNALAVLNIVGYLTATIVFSVGIAILLGIIPLPAIPGTYRTVLGVAMIGYGIMRAAMLQIRYRKSRRVQAATENESDE